jgi:Mg/Co/Ni transporter MgtE
MHDGDLLLALVRRFLDARDEHCLGNLLEDMSAGDLARVLSELGLDQRAVVVRLLASRREGAPPVSAS